MAERRPKKGGAGGRAGGRRSPAGARARKAPRADGRWAAWHDAPFGVVTLGKDLACTSVNPVFAAMVGREAERCLGMKVVDLIPGAPPVLEDVVRGVLDSGTPRYRVAVDFHSGDATVRRCDLTMFRFGSDEPGGPGVAAVARDLGVLEALEGSARLASLRTEVAAERLGRLQSVTAELSAAVTEEEVARVILDLGLQVLGATGGSLSFPEGGEPRLAHAAGPVGPDADGLPGFLGPVTAEALERKEAVWIGSAAELAERYPALAPSRGAMSDASWAAVPLVVRGRAVGVLGIGFAGPYRFDDESRAFIEALARQAALAVDRARLFEAQRAMRAEAEHASEEREALVRELRRTLRERDESMALLDALFDNAPVGLALLDREMRFVRVNAHLARMNERPIADYLGRALWDVLPPVAREELARDFRRVLEERVPVEERPVSTTGPGGRSRYFLASWFPVAVAERLIGVGLLLRDVTEQRRAEQSQRHLLGVVGHDLRSPLMAITASAELMQASPLDDRAARSVGRILRAAHRIDGIIRALVDYTLVQVGSGIPLHRRPTDLAAVVQAVAEEAEAAHPGRMVTVVAPAQVRGEWDPDRLGQALANLLGNALQYGQEDLAVRVTCRSEVGAGILEVTNEGPPIPGDLVPHLFEPFRRGNDDRSQRRKGLGLGLFIAQQIVHAHGGRIEVRSGTPAGTTFTVRIPAGAPPAAPPAVSRDRDPGP